MATATRHLCRSFLQVSRHIPAKRKCGPKWLAQTQTIAARPFSSTTSCRAWEQRPENISTSATTERVQEIGEEDIDLATLDTDEFLTPSNPIRVQDLSPEARADYEVLPKNLQPKWLALQNHYKASAESPEYDAELDQIAEQVAREVDREEPINFPNVKLRPNEVGIWAEDEDDEFGRVEDDDGEFNEQEDITSVAHSELELHRDMRDYARIATWDMPLLSKFAKPFEPPQLASPLRFRYTTYMGEGHPAALKVVVQFCTRDLPGLTEPQRIKLIKLAGVRYNPETDIIKMSCEKFEAPAQNKRYLGDLITKLVTEAKDSKDAFDDVPLDFRHHKPKKAPMFPEEWKMKPERVQMLLEQRKQAKLLEEARSPVDGKQLVEEYVLATPRGARLSPLR